MNREILERPFPEALIKSRRGAFGQNLSYVEGVEYIKRLNEAFEGKWSFEIVEHQIKDNEVIVLGKLSAEGISKMAFGGSAITMTRETGEVLSIADDLKAAATDALKKACSLFGVGLYLYSETQSNGNDQQPVKRNSPKNSPAKLKVVDSGTNNNGSSGNKDRLTQKQLSAIWSMGRALNQSADAIRQRSMKIFGVVPEQLTRTDASSFITEMGEALGGNSSSVGVQ